VPTEQEVASFLDECCEVARSAVETRLVATRSAFASLLSIHEHCLDKKFASNCNDTRIKTLQEQARLVNQQQQASQQQASGVVLAMSGGGCSRGARHQECVGGG
jgi:hypothetical protein